MAFTGIMTTEAAIDMKSGAGVSASYTADMKTISCSQGQSMVNVVARENYSDSYAGLNADVQGLLSDITSSFVAIHAITYDMSGYTSRTEAEDMINVLRDGLLRGLAILRDDKAQRFINAA